MANLSQLFNTRLNINIKNQTQSPNETQKLT